MVKLLKSGSWALEGTNVVEMAEGEEKSFGPVEDFKLVESGWADWVKVEAPKVAENTNPKRKA